MKSSVLVSVVVPVYNAADFLPETLKALSNQSLKEIEIICVNDGSTDDSLSMLKEFADKDSRIKVIDSVNEGAGAARNKGLAVAQGRYVSFLDADDIFDSKLLEIAYLRAEEKQADIVFYDFESYAGQLQTKSKNRFSESVNLAEKKFSFSLSNPACWTKLYRRDFIQKNNLTFQNLSSCNDIGFSWTALACAKRIFYINQVLLHYRRDTGTNISSNRYMKAGNIIQAYSFIEEFLVRNHLDEKLDLFRKTILSSFRYELTHFPVDVSAANFLKDVERVLPKKYFEEFWKKIVKVTFIVPVFNVENYLKECLDSILNQTMREIEIICINDGSTDSSLEILKQYEKLDSRIRIIDQKNQGLSVSRNNALAIARGLYAVFVDSDDYVRQDLAQIVFARMSTNQLDMLSYSGCNFVDGTTEMLPNEYWEFKWLPKGFNTEAFTLTDVKPHLTRLAVSSCLTAYRIQFIKEQGFEFPKGLCFEDNLFFARAMMLASKRGIVLDKFYYRRLHSAQITQNWEKHFADYLKISDLLLEWLKAHAENSIFEKYRYSYLMGCINRFNKFSQTGKRDYAASLCSLVDKYQFDKKKIDLPKETEPVALKESNGKQSFPWYKLCGSITEADTRKVYFVGICIFKYVDDERVKSLSICGLPIFWKYKDKFKSKLNVLGLPLYSRTRKNFKVRTRVLFVRYSHKDNFARLLSAVEQQARVIDDLKKKSQVHENEILTILSLVQDGFKKSNEAVKLVDQRLTFIDEKLSGTNQKMDENQMTLRQRIEDQRKLVLEVDSTLSNLTQTVNDAYQSTLEANNQLSEKQMMLGQRIEDQRKLVLEVDSTLSNLTQTVNDAHQSTLEATSQLSEKQMMLGRRIEDQQKLSLGIDSSLSRTHQEALAISQKLGQLTLQEQKSSDDVRGALTRLQNSCNELNVGMRLICHHHKLNGYQKKLSIILPVYNGEKYLQTCVKSVLSQSFRDFEFICVDDGSTDSSLDILNDFALQDSRMIVCHQNNQGVSAARNKGLDIAVGEWVTFIDSDDSLGKMGTWRGDELEKLIQAIESDVDWIVPKASVLYDEDAPIPNKEQHKRYYESPILGTVETDNPVVQKTAVNAWGKLHRRSLIEDANLRFPVGKRYEDEYWFPCYSLLAKNIKYIDLDFYTHLCGSTGIMAETRTSGDFSIAQERLCVAEEMIRFYQTRNKENEYHEMLMNRFYGLYQSSRNWVAEECRVEVDRLAGEILRRLDFDCSGHKVLEKLKLNY